MNILYYSNYCPHSISVLDFLKQHNLLDKLNFLCVDDRQQDSKTGIIYIISKDKKKKELLPPNVQEVPTLLLVRENYQIITGKDIIRHFEPKVKNVFSEIREPEPQPLNNNSQSFSNYGTTDMCGFIETPPDNFSSNKIGENITIEIIKEQRDNELQRYIK